MTELLEIIWKWKVRIALLIVLAGIAAVIITMPSIMPPYYSSSVYFYPSNPAKTDRAAMFNQESGDVYNYFGGKDDVDRMLSIAGSSGLYDYMVDKYDLIDHYDIDTSKVDKYRYYVRRELAGNYKAVKTDLGSIEVRVLDKDRELAAKMANDISAYIDSVNKNILRETKFKTINVLKEDLKKQESQVAELADSLAVVRRKYNVTVSSEGVINSSSGYGSELYRILEERQKSMLETVNDMSRLYNQYLISARDDFSSIYIIEKAEPAEVKSKPIRWMILAGALAGAAFAGIFLAVVIEGIRNRS